MFCAKKISAENKAVLITGCDSGFGNRLALRLNKKGFRVYATVLDTNYCGSKDLTEKCVDTSRMSVIQMDVTNDHMINDCFEFVKKDLDTNEEVLWALVNNAGLASCGHTNWGQFDEYYKVFNVNTFGVVRVTRKFTPLIIKSQGRIVITASMLGRVTMDNFGLYCMSKSAVISYSNALRREMRKFKVNVSTVEPFLFKTPMVNNLETLFERTISQTDPDVRQLYGDQYFEDQLKKFKTDLKLLMGSKDINIVVNDMIDAIISESPYLRYVPAPNFIFKLVRIFLPIIPQWLIDWVFIKLDKTVPVHFE